jgi:hypothetical protein
MRQVVFRGGTTIVGRATRYGSRWLILRGDHLVDLYSTRSLGSHPVLSADGRYAAWATYVDERRYSDFEAETTFTVTAYDVDRGAVVGTTAMRSHTYCCDGGGRIDVAGVDNDGAVVLMRSSDRAWVWRPGGAPVPLSGAVRASRLAMNDPWPGGVSWTIGNSSDDPAAYGRVSTDGAVTRLGRVPQSQDGLWSPQAGAYVYSPAVKERQLRPVVWRDGRRQRLDAPKGAWPLAWESERRVLLVDGDEDASIRLVRCWVSDGRCEQAGPRLRHAQVPRSAY